MKNHLDHTPLTIGVLAGWQIYGRTNMASFLGPLLMGLRLASQQRGCTMLLSCGLGPHSGPINQTRPAWPTLDAAVDFVPVGPWNTDGLIVINPLLAPARSDYLHGVIAAGHPTVFIGSAEGGPAIAIENTGSIRQAVAHLAAHGHRQIAFIAGNPADVAGDSGERLRAYRLAVAEHGLVADERLVEYGYHVVDGGRVAMARLLATRLPFTAVIASNDESAIGAMAQIQAAGLAVPGDIAIIGMDDQPRALVQKPPLTSIHVPAFEMGYQAIDLMLGYIHRRRPAGAVVRVPTRLIVRQSCGCPAEQPDSGLAAPLERAADSRPAGLVEALAAAVGQAVAARTQQMRADDVAAFAHQLTAAFVAGCDRADWQEFQQALHTIVGQTGAVGDDAHAWQAAISTLRAEAPALLAGPAAAATLQRASEILDQARVAISEDVQRQYRQHLVSQVSTTDQVGLLTARLLTALDEGQIGAALHQYLPETNIRWAALAFFEAEGADPVAWSRLRIVTDPDSREVRLASRDFPRGAQPPPATPTQLAVFPLVYNERNAGFMAFESTDLELCAAIVRQVAAAFRNVYLHGEALEGRRLAEEANRLKGHFLSMVSHELRTPLHLIIQLSALVVGSHGASNPGLARQDLERIQASAQYLDDLIRDVLDLASSDVGQIRLAYEALDPAGVLQSAALVGEQLASAKGLGWRASLPAALPRVWGDPARLRQIVLNVISNAVKFTAQGEIRLEAAADAGQIMIAVSDTGPGVPESEQAAIFESFRQSDRTVAQGYGGLGLGLAICKRLVELHGGSIGVESPGAGGVGSTFRIMLPALGERPAPPLPSAGAGDILVVLDQAAADTALRDQLESSGFPVRVERIEERASWLPLLADQPPQAVIFQADQVSAAGWDLLRSFKSNPALHETAVLFYAPAGERASGAVLELDYLAKPIGSRELARALERLGLDEQGQAADAVILIVDDEPGMLDVHVRLVRAAAPTYRILTARNGREALEIARRDPPDLIILDLMMPVMDGFAALEALRAEEMLRSIPVIVMTAQILTDEDMARLSHGVVSILGKGVFSSQETLAHIEEALTGKRKPGGGARRLVRKAMAYMHTHYSQPLSLAEVARHASVNEDYLARCFRQEVGLTPMAYLNRYRVNQAKGLLAAGRQSILEVALEVGFSDSSYFSQVFRREVGMSPRAYRQQHS